MTDTSTHRILLITDEPTPSAVVLDLLRQRAAAGPVALHVVVTNPLRAEAHLRHPLQHDALPEVQGRLDRELPAYRAAAGASVEGEVSIRHDAFEAVEDALGRQDADEIVIGHHHDSALSRRAHHDLQHRLAGLHRRVTAPTAVLA